MIIFVSMICLSPQSAFPIERSAQTVSKVRVLGSVGKAIAGEGGNKTALFQCKDVGLIEPERLVKVRRAGDMRSATTIREAARHTGEAHGTQPAAGCARSKKSTI